jgi:pilus assembly protein Flp/PilA
MIVLYKYLINWHILPEVERSLETPRYLAAPAGGVLQFQRRETGMRGILAFLRDNSGAAAAEYALILAIVGAGLATAAFALGTDIATALSAAGTAITNMSFANT